jgi:hypothetical protein
MIAILLHFCWRRGSKPATETAGKDSRVFFPKTLSASLAFQSIPWYESLTPFAHRDHTCSIEDKPGFPLEFAEIFP